MRIIKFLAARVSQFSAAQLTLISFVVISLLGGLVLTYTERNTYFEYKKPVVTTVEVNTTDADGKTQIPHEEARTVIKTEKKKGLKYTDALFTATSALCVTGLTSVDFSEFTLAGQIATMIMIQIGGLGIILFTSIFAMALFRGLSERTPLRNVLSSVLDSSHSDVIDMVKYVVMYTVLIEGSAILIMGSYLQITQPEALNGVNPWWWSLFHAISAFNNAGFSLMQDNLSGFTSDALINTVIGGLIVLGGIGYPVFIGFHLFVRERILKLNGSSNKHLRKDVSGVASRVQMKVALWGTLILLVVGSVGIFVIESQSHGALAGYGKSTQVIAAIFQSISTRTAGFNTINFGLLHSASIFLIMALMYIGANPAGTAGGIKITTMATLYGYAKDWFASPGQPVRLFNTNISKFVVSHAVRLFFFSAMLLVLVAFAIAVAEDKYLETVDPIFNFQKILFEVVSAFGTVGLSLGFPGGVTSFSAVMSTFSKMMIVMTMWIGRVGPLTVLQSIPWKHPDAHKAISPDFDKSQRLQIG